MRVRRPRSLAPSTAVFSADLAANLLVTMLLLFVLVAGRTDRDAGPISVETLRVLSGRAWVDTLHALARGEITAVELRTGVDPSASCTGTPPTVVLVFDAGEVPPARGRAVCGALQKAPAMFVPSALVGEDGHWSEPMRRLLASPGSPDFFRVRLLLLLEGGLAAEAVTASGGARTRAAAADFLAGAIALIVVAGLGRRFAARRSST